MYTSYTTYVQHLTFHVILIKDERGVDEGEEITSLAVFPALMTAAYKGVGEQNKNLLPIFCSYTSEHN